MPNIKTKKNQAASAFDDDYELPVPPRRPSRQFAFHEIYVTEPRRRRLVFTGRVIAGPVAHAETGASEVTSRDSYLDFALSAGHGTYHRAFEGSSGKIALHSFDYDEGDGTIWRAELRVFDDFAALLDDERVPRAVKRDLRGASPSPDRHGPRVERLDI